jgi:NitT/TauT family transport system substrate-binding protein
MRKILSVAAVPLALSLALVLAGCSGGTDRGASATIGMSYIPNIQFAPFYVAKDKGIFTENGVDAEIRHHGADEGLFTAIASGREQFVVAAGDEALQAAEQGVDLVAVASYYRAYPVRVIVPDSSDITGLTDLRGKRVGIPGRYGESWFGLLVALESAGLAETDVEVVEIGYTQQAALTTGKIDASVGFVNNDFLQFQLAGFGVRALQLTDDGEPPLVSATLFTTRALLDAQPDLVRHVADSLVRGIDATAQDQDAAIEAAGKFIPDLTDAAKESAKVTLQATLQIMVDGTGRASGKLVPEQWQKMADFMVAAGLLESAPDIGRIVATDMVSS